LHPPQLSTLAPPTTSVSENSIRRELMPVRAKNTSFSHAFHHADLNPGPFGFSSSHTIATGTWILIWDVSAHNPVLGLDIRHPEKQYNARKWVKRCGTSQAVSVQASGAQNTFHFSLSASVHQRITIKVSPPEPSWPLTICEKVLSNENLPRNAQPFSVPGDLRESRRTPCPS
jgi:hypothetical protein